MGGRGGHPSGPGSSFCPGLGTWAPCRGTRHSALGDWWWAAPWHVWAGAALRLWSCHPVRKHRHRHKDTHTRTHTDSKFTLTQSMTHTHAYIHTLPTHTHKHTPNKHNAHINDHPGEQFSLFWTFYNNKSTSAVDLKHRLKCKHYR